MKTSSSMMLLALLIAAVAAGRYYGSDDASPLGAAPSQVSASERRSIVAGSASGAVSQPLPVKPDSVAASAATSASSPSAAAASMGQLERRIVALEAQVKALQQALAGVSLERASADRQKLFAAEEGYLKADEYAAVGQHAIAGEGYLTFLHHHPQHPDARDVMKKARDALLKAGYKVKAFWVQDEMMKANPQHQSADLEELAHIEKEAGLYERALEHMNQSAERDSDVESRLWKRMYWAWFVQMHRGNAAGIEALRQVQREIAASGINNPQLNQRAQQHLTEWQRMLSPER